MARAAQRSKQKSSKQQAAAKRRRPGVPPTVAKAPKPTLGSWIGAARPATLGLSIAPVAIGYGAATVAQQADLLITLLCLAVAVFLQIGANFANDFSDGVRGTDKHRVGPSRLVGSGAVAPKTVLIIALVFFALAAAAGLGIVVLTQYWWLLAVGAAALLAAWFYTGGPKPYGYYGLGEVFVFLFFGLAATLGTMFVNTGALNQEAEFGAYGIGSIAVAVLMINNLRDRDQDKAAGKRTLAVLIGSVATKVLIVLTLIVVPGAITALLQLAYSAVGFAFFAAIPAIPAAIIVIWGKTAPELVTALKLAGLTGLLWGVLVAVGLIV